LAPTTDLLHRLDLLAQADIQLGGIVVAEQDRSRAGIA
jgi:hypothetical protein